MASQAVAGALGAACLMAGLILAPWPHRAQAQVLAQDQAPPAVAGALPGAAAPDAPPSAPAEASPDATPGASPGPMTNGFKRLQSTEGEAGPPMTAPAAAPAPRLVPVTVERPRVVTTGRIADGEKVLPLWGVVGQDGEAAQTLGAQLDSAGGPLKCLPHDDTGFDCTMSNGTDLALFALVNGQAQVRPDAPPLYQAQEVAARDARRGIWSNLPPPPVSLRHPGLYDTATLVADAQRYPLSGIEGTGGRLAGEMAGYIQLKGDEVTCQPQGEGGGYVCLLTDGTDIATVALVNGAARTTPDAPDAYRLQEADAVEKRRGVWEKVSDQVIRATLRYDAQRRSAGDGGEGFVPLEPASADGVVYVGGQPTAAINEETVFLVYGGVLGWGYYDRGRHWHGAPDRFSHHMERFHPEGRGLRGYPERAAFHPGGLDRGLAGRPGFERAGLERPGVGFARPGFERGGFNRPVMERPGFERPVHPAFLARPGAGAGGAPGLGTYGRPGPGLQQASVGAGRPGFVSPGGSPRFASPGLPPQGMARPGQAMPGMRPGFAPPGRVAMPMGGARPMAAPAFARPAPAAQVRVAAPVARAALPARTCTHKC